MSLRLLRPHIGRLLVAGLAGDRVPVELTSLIREFDIGGVVLAPGHVSDPLRVAELAREIQALGREVPPWVALHPDAPSRVPPADAWPPLAALGHADDPALTTAYATALARERLALGLTLEFGPVLDLESSRASGAVRAHTIARDATLAARHTRAIVETARALGLATCGRHFPGTGEAEPDAGGACPLVELPPDRLEAVEWVPFRAAFEAGLPAVMVGHVIVPALDEQRPAVLSRPVLHHVLRANLGFTGVVFSDDMDTWPASSLHGDTSAAVPFLRAGGDVVFQGGGVFDSVAATLEDIVKAAERDELRVSRLEDALKRHDAMKADYLSADARRMRPVPPTLAEFLAASEAEAVAGRMQEFV